MDIKSLSDEELLEQYHFYESRSVIGDITQFALKILLNSGYGAFSSPYFQFSDLRLSRSITLSGQCAIRWVEKWINNFLNQYFHTDNIDYCITIDTDSVVGDTDIIVNGTKIKIKDYYDSIGDENFIRYDDFNHNYIKFVSNGDKSLSLFNDNLYEGKIKYIMKHKVKKEMFEISIDNKSVIVTEDHSIIVERNNNIISVNPKNILKNDKIIFI